MNKFVNLNEINNFLYYYIIDDGLDNVIHNYYQLYPHFVDNEILNFKSLKNIEKYYKRIFQDIKNSNWTEIFETIECDNLERVEFSMLKRTTLSFNEKKIYFYICQDIDEQEDCFYIIYVDNNDFVLISCIGYHPFVACKEFTLGNSDGSTFIEKELGNLKTINEKINFFETCFFDFIFNQIH